MRSERGGEAPDDGLHVHAVFGVRFDPTGIRRMSTLFEIFPKSFKFKVT